MGSRGLRASQCLAIGCLLLAPIALTAPGSPTPACSLAAPAATIIGPLVATKGSTATFSIESIEPFPRPPGPPEVPPDLVPEQTVAVQYESGQTRFLAIGSRYRVELISLGSRYWSGIYVAGRECQGGGTRFADMRVIDMPGRGFPVAAVGVVGLALVVVVTTGVLVARSGRRRRLADGG